MMLSQDARLTLDCQFGCNVDCLRTCGSCPVCLPPLVRTLSACRARSRLNLSCVLSSARERGCKWGRGQQGPGLTSGFKWCAPLCCGLHQTTPWSAPECGVVCTICGSTLVPTTPEASNRLPTRSAETYPVSPGERITCAPLVSLRTQDQVLRWEWQGNAMVGIIASLTSLRSKEQAS